MKCFTCSHPLQDDRHPCPRCNCIQYDLGSIPNAEQILAQVAVAHRMKLLAEFDFGITVYSWKELDGNIVLDSASRVSFGPGNQLLNSQTWLPEKFARIPGETEISLDLSIRRTGDPDRLLEVCVPLPQEPELLQLGITIHDDLTVALMLKNDTTATRSGPVEFLMV